MDERLTAFGSQVIDSHMRSRERLSSLGDGTYTGIELQAHE